MENPRLLALAIIFILIGAFGLTVSTWFAGKQTTRDGAISMMDMMMDMMMGKGMMNKGQMKDMMKSMMPGMLPPGIKPENLPEPNSTGAKLLIRYCAQCHDLPSPFMHSGEEWPVTAGRMFARMSMMSGMQGMSMMAIESPLAEEKETIVGYLKKHSMESISPKELPDPGSESAVLFRGRCSQCHALPNPKLHTAKEWPSVVERMQGNMESMGRKVLTENEKKEIVGYLVNQARK